MPKFSSFSRNFANNAIFTFLCHFFLISIVPNYCVPRIRTSLKNIMLKKTFHQIVPKKCLFFLDMISKSKFEGTNKWLSAYKKRNGVSHQKKTNNKSKSIQKRLPQIKNFHWWVIYKMATENP